MKKKKKLDNIVSLDEVRKKNKAKILTISEIQKEMKSDKYVVAVALLVPKDGEPIFVANTRLNPLECAGICLNFANQCSQRNNFEDAVLPEDEHKYSNE